MLDLYSIETFALVGIGGAFGALARYAVIRSVPSQNFPVGTFIVNVIGSFILGAFTFSNSSSGISFINRDLEAGIGSPPNLLLDFA